MSMEIGVIFAPYDGLLGYYLVCVEMDDGLMGWK